MEPEFDLSLFVAGDLLFVTVVVPFGASRHHIESCLFNIETAIARVESVDEKQLTGFLWEQKRTVGGSKAYAARRRFADASRTLTIRNASKPNGVD